MRHIAMGLSLLLLLALPTAARAASDAQWKALVKQGQQQYQAGDYTGSVQTLLKAYELKPNPTLLFNIARAYDKADQPDNALSYYRRYRDSSPDDAKLVGEASRAIDRLEALQKDRDTQKRAEEAKRQAEQKAEADRIAQQKADLEKAQAEQKHQQELAAQQQAQPPPKRSRVLPYTLIGVGGAALVGGAVLGITANGLANDEKKSIDPVAKPNLRHDAKQRALFADVAYGVGAAALATGIVLIATEPKVEKVASRLPTPVLFDHGAGLAFGGSL